MVKVDKSSVDFTLIVTEEDCILYEGKAKAEELVDILNIIIDHDRLHISPFKRLVQEIGYVAVWEVFIMIKCKFVVETQRKVTLYFL
jgi:hypothetical protein